MEGIKVFKVLYLKLYKKINNFISVFYTSLHHVFDVKQF